MKKGLIFFLILFPFLLLGQNNRSDSLKNDLLKIKILFNSINSILPRGSIYTDSAKEYLFIELYVERIDNSTKTHIFQRTSTEVKIQPIDTFNIRKYCLESNVNFNDLFELISLMKKYEFKEIDFVGPGDLIACSIFVGTYQSSGFVIYNRSRYCRKKDCFWPLKNEELKKIFPNIYYLTWKPEN